MRTSATNAAGYIFFAGLVAGTMDICSAFIDYYIKTGNGPDRVLRYVASGVFGSKAFSENVYMPWLGLLFHYIIAFLFTLFFYLICQRLKLLRKNIFLTAILYSLFVWLIMNMIVVPLSNAPQTPFNIWNATKALLILICMIGLPLSFIMKRATSHLYNKNKSDNIFI